MIINFDYSDFFDMLKKQIKLKLPEDYNCIPCKVWANNIHELSDERPMMAYVFHWQGYKSLSLEDDIQTWGLKCEAVIPNSTALITFPWGTESDDIATDSAPILLHVRNQDFELPTADVNS